MNKLIGRIKRDAERKIYSIVASTNDVDRDSEIVDPRGCNNLPVYLSKNPVILWGHDYQKPPIAKAVDGRQFDDRIELDIEFAETPFAQEVKYLYDEGFMNSFSIGFIPKDWKRINDDFVWTDWELLETSAVPVPANSAANIIRSVKSKGVALEEIEKLFDQQDTRSADETAQNEPEVRKAKSKLKSVFAR